MFALKTFTTTILAILSFSAHAFPLSERDVIAPKILQPNSNSVWSIGTQELVIWDTSKIPPPSQVTNPMGKIVLGFNESDSLNLDLDHPLAQNFLLTDGNVTITVPNVPPRDDYLIVLFGDSGNTSPSFAITRIATSNMDPSASSPSSGSTSDSSAVPATSLSLSASMATPTLTGGSTNAVAPTTGTPTTPTTGSSTTPGSASSSVSAAASASTPSSSTSSGWSLHRGSSTWSSAAPFLMTMAPLVMVFVV